MVLQDHGRRSDVTFLVQTFWTPTFRQELTDEDEDEFLWEALSKRHPPGTDFLDTAI